MEERQRQTLANQFAMADSLNLGDLLKEEDRDENRQKRSAGSKTLLDIINEEQQTTTACNSDNNNNNKIKWKSFKAHLKPRRSATRSGRSDEILENPFTTIPANPIVVQRNSPGMEMEATDSIQPNIEQDWRSMATSGNEGVPTVSDEVPTAPLRVSLLTLLEQADQSSSIEAVKKEEEEEEGKEDDEEAGVACCVCMVRHKGAAFIPCGHTFCRRCSRELWVNRGSCPLCNGYIMEILDIF